jgi:hypothetical protein
MRAEQNTATEMARQQPNESLTSDDSMLQALIPAATGAWRAS